MVETMKRILALPEDGEARERYVGTVKAAGIVVLNVALLLSATGSMVMHASLANWLLCTVVLVSWFLLGRVK